MGRWLCAPRAHHHPLHALHGRSGAAGGPHRHHLAGPAPLLRVSALPQGQAGHGLLPHPGQAGEHRAGRRRLRPYQKGASPWSRPLRLSVPRAPAWIPLQHQPILCCPFPQDGGTSEGGERDSEGSAAGSVPPHSPAPRPRPARSEHRLPHPQMCRSCRHCCSSTSPAPGWWRTSGARCFLCCPTAGPGTELLGSSSGNWMRVWASWASPATASRTRGWRR